MVTLHCTKKLLDRMKIAPQATSDKDSLAQADEPLPAPRSRHEFSIECEREDDGRWIAEIPELPGALAYGNTPEEAMARSEVLALRAIAEQLEHGESGPKAISISIPA